MATPNLAERLEIDGVPLSTPAWEIEDLAPLWDTPEVLGGDQEVPYRRGVVPFRRAYGAKRVDLPMVIVGDYDPDGQPAADPRAQLWANRRELIRTVFRPIQINTTDGDRLVRYHAPDGVTLAGPGQIVGGLRPTQFGPAAFKASLSLSLSEGGLRSETQTDQTSPSIADGVPTNYVVANAGDDFQDELLIDLSGTASVVRLTNLTADPGGDVWWEFGGDVTPGVAINTADFTAVRSGVSVVGLVNYSGFERWLPLVPGSNTIEISPTGGTATVRFRHFPFYP